MLRRVRQPGRGPERGKVVFYELRMWLHVELLGLSLIVMPNCPMKGRIAAMLATILKEEIDAKI